MFHVEQLLRVADQEDAGGGAGNWLGRVPAEFGEELDGGGLLGGADQEGEAASGSEERLGDGEHLVKALDGTQGYDIGGGGWVSFGASVEDFSVTKGERADDLTEEDRLLLVGFDESEAQGWIPDPHGEAGEARAGAEIEQVSDAGRRREEPAGGEEGLGEMSCYDTFPVAHRSQVHAGVPAF